MFAHLNLLIWLYDMLGYEKSTDDIISSLKSVFEICFVKVLKINPLEYDLVTNKAQSCGRLIDSK